jgi:gamma-F420-2:alpha-L-glutamate ligase
MEGLVVSNGFRLLSSTDYKIRRLQEEFGKHGVGIDHVDSFGLSLAYADSSLVSQGLDQYAFCIYLDKDESISAMLEKKMPVYNNSQALISCNDKLKTFLALDGTGIKMPLTIPSRLCFRPEEADEKKISDFADMVGSRLGYPLICKACYGSLGLQVFLIHDKEELVKKYKELLLVPHLYQKFVTTSVGRDFRIFTIGGKAVAYMERVNDHDFRSNIALGGKGYLIAPPAGFLETAERASQALGLDYAGVDILIGEQETPLLSEVNSNAFFTEIESVSHVNVTALLASHILDDLQRRQERKGKETK